jgi:hypothetical protein
MERLAVVVDAGVVVAFVTIGRDAHDEGTALAGILETGAPFLLALGLGWVATRAWRDPTDLKVGAGVAAITVAGGMLARRFIFDDGTAASFIVVASVFLGGAMLGWRAVARRFARRTAAV